MTVYEVAREALKMLELIALGWTVIESDGDRMTIQAPADWEEEGDVEGDPELIVDTRYLSIQLHRAELEAA